MHTILKAKLAFSNWRQMVAYANWQLHTTKCKLER